MQERPNTWGYGRNFDKRTVQMKKPRHHERVDDMTLTTRQWCEIIAEARALGAELLETWEELNCLRLGRMSDGNR